MSIMFNRSKLVAVPTEKGSRRAAVEEIQFFIGECSPGSLLVARSAKGICALLLGDAPDALARDLKRRFPQAHLTAGDAGLEKLLAKLPGFMDAPQRAL